MSKVEIELTAKEQQMVQAWKRGQQSIKAFNAELDKVGGKTRQNQKQGDRFFKSVDSGVSSAITRFVGVGAAIAGIGKAASIVRQEYDHLLQRQKTAADRQIDTARAQRSAIQNLGDDPTLSVDQLNQRIAEISGKTGVSQGVLFKSASNAFSAKGKNLSAAQALDAVETGARQTPDDPAAIQQIASGILALQKKGGGLARDIAGFNISTMQASRVQDTSAFINNVNPAIAQLTDFGDTRKQAGALIATITQGAEDAQGNVSATAAVKFGQQLQQLLPELESTTARLKFINSDDPKGSRIRDRLLGSLQKETKSAEAGELKAEAKTLTTLAALLQAGPNSTKQLLQENTKAIPAIGAVSGKAFEDFMGSVDRQPIQQTARIKRAGMAAAEAVQIGNTRGAQSSVIRDTTEQIASALGHSATRTKLSTLGEDFASGGNRDLSGFIEDLEALQRETKNTKLKIAPDRTGQMTKQYDPASVRDAGAIGNLVTSLREIAALQRETAANNKTEQQLYYEHLRKVLDDAHAEREARKADASRPVNLKVHVQAPSAPRGAAALGVKGG